MALIAAPQGGFIASQVWEIAGRKNLTIFKGCYYSRFYMMISSNFREIETKNLNSDLCILTFLALGTKSRAAYIGYLNIGNGHEIEATICGLS